MRLQSIRLVKYSLLFCFQACRNIIPNCFEASDSAEGNFRSNCFSFVLALVAAIIFFERLK